jgi:hypothetical protein
MDGPQGQADNDCKGELLRRFRSRFGPRDEQKRPGADEDQPPGINAGNKIRSDAGAFFTENSDGCRQRKGGNEKNGDFSAGGY